MRAYVDSLIRIPPSTPAKVLEHVRQRLTLDNPEHVKKTRMGLSTFACAAEICLLTDLEGGWHTIPRGSASADILNNACSSAGEPLEYTDHRLDHPRTSIPFKFQLRNYQETAVDALARRVQGVAQAPCGAGKTVIGVALIARLGRPALVIVHTHDLVEQWRSTIKDATGMNVGIISDGEQIVQPITVATVQSISRLPAQELKRPEMGFSVVIVDEAHHTPASTFMDLLAHLPGRHRYGLTATPDRSDGLTPLIGLCISPVVYKIDHQELVDAGHLVVPEVIKVQTGCNVDAGDYGQMIKGLEADNSRISMMAGLLDGRPTLILSTRVDHCTRIAETLADLGHDAESLSGRTPKAKRKNILDRFKAGRLKVLCATTLADEGLDVARLERLILALPSRAEGRTIQRLGRLMRPHPGKLRPVLFDLVDDHPIAKRQWQARRRAYRQTLGEGCIK